MANTVNMSLDDIIKQNKTKGRGGATPRGTQRGRGKPRGGRGTRVGQTVRGTRGQLKGPRAGGIAARIGIKRGRGRTRGGLQTRISRIDTLNNAQNNPGRSRSQSNRRGRSLSRGRPQNRGTNRQRSQNRQAAQIRSTSRQRSRSRQTRAASRQRSLSRNNFQQQQNNQQRARSRSRSRGPPRRGRGRGNLRTRGNLRAVGISTKTLREVNQARLDNLIHSQIFTRSKSPGRTLTVRVANSGIPKRRPLNRKRRLSASNIGYLNKDSLATLAAALGGANLRRGPGSVRSKGSNRQVLDPQLQMEIAAIQGNRTPTNNQGVNFIPVPHLTTTTLSQRFSSLT